MILPHSRGDKILVRFRGREFEYWNGCGFTCHRRNAIRYCYSEAKGCQRRMNDSGDFPFKVSVVDYVERLSPYNS